MGLFKKKKNVMSQEEKDLLLKDLTARLPYGVRCSYPYGVDTLQSIDLNDMSFTFDCPNDDNYYEIDGIRPYLRPMEDMTEEECDMVEAILGDENIFDFMRNGDIILKEGKFTQVMLSRLYDYFNSIHVDYRGLIPKGLALKAKEGIYNN